MLKSHRSDGFVFMPIIAFLIFTSQIDFFIIRAPFLQVAERKEFLK